MGTGDLGLGVIVTASLDAGINSAFKTLDDRAISTQKRLDKVTLGRKLTTELTKTSTALQRLKSRQDVQAGSNEKLNASVARLESRYRAAQFEAKKYGLDIRNVAGEHRRLGTELQRTEGRLTRIAARQRNQQRRQNLRGEIAGTVATGISLALPVKAAIDFESAMANVKKTVNDLDAVGLKTMAKQLKSMSREIPISASGLAEIASAGGRLGIQKDKLQEYVRITAEMAVAFDMLPDEAGDASAKLANVWDLPITGVRRLGDAINYLDNNTAAKAPEIIRTLQRVGGQAKQFGLLETEAAALASTFISLGRPPEVAGTAINAMLLKMQAATKQGGKFKAALNEMGYSAIELENHIKVNAQGALQGFLATLSDMDKHDRAGLLADLFGLEYSDDISILAGSMDEYRRQLKLLANDQDFANSMSKEFETRAETTANKIQITKNKVAELGVNIGTILLPAVNSTLGVIGEGVSTLADFAEAHPTITKLVVGTAAGLAVLKVGTLGAKYAWTVLSDGLHIAKGGLLRTTGWLKKGFSALKTFAGGALKLGRVALPLLTTGIRAVGSVLKTFAGGALKLGRIALPLLATGIRAVGMALMANPIGLAVTGIAGGAYLIVKHWEPIKEWFGGLWTGIKRIAGQAVDWVMNKLTAPIKLVGKGVQLLKDFLGFGDEEDGEKETTTAVKKVPRARSRYRGRSRAGKPSVAIDETSIAVAKTASRRRQRGAPIKQKFNYQVKVEVHNPTNNVDVEAAIENAMHKQQIEQEAAMRRSLHD